MLESPIVGTRVPQDWHQQIQAIASAAGRKEAKVVTEVIAQYLGRTDPHSVMGVIAELQERVASLERKLAGLRRSVS